MEEMGEGWVACGSLGTEERLPFHLRDQKTQEERPGYSHSGWEAVIFPKEETLCFRDCVPFRALLCISQPLWFCRSCPTYSGGPVTCWDHSTCPPASRPSAAHRIQDQGVSQRACFTQLVSTGMCAVFVHSFFHFLTETMDGTVG